MQDLHRTPTGNGESLILKPRLAVVAPRVYLAGPIKGLQYSDATAWRAQAKEALAPEIVTFSPMRTVPFTGSPVAASYEDSLLDNNKALTIRDRFDTKRADMVIAYLAGASAVSIGTCIEIGWASAYDVPIVLVEEPDGLHWHPMTRELSGWIVSSVEDAVFVARSVLLP